MTKKYILTKDQIQSSVGTSDYPPSSTAVNTALAAKVAIAQGTTYAGKFLKVGADGNVTTGDATSQVQANWTETDTSASAYIANKPFVSIGTGLTVTNDVLTANTQFKFQIFSSLPTASSTYAQTIALILKTETETGNLYDEYACVETSGSWAWEKIGSTDFELTITQNASGITINDTALQSATSSQKGLLTAADWTTFNGKQNALTFDTAPTASSTNPVTSGGVSTALDAKEATANRVSSWSTTVSDNKYPTEKLVKDSLDAKVDLAGGSVSLGKDSTGYYFNE